MTNKTIEKVAMCVAEEYMDGTVEDHHRHIAQAAIEALEEDFVLVSKDDIIILPHDAEPELGDVLYIENEDDGIEYPCLYNEKYHKTPIHYLNIKIIQRNGKLAKQESE